MRETVVLLAGPSACFDIVDRAEITSPVGLARHLVELGVLHHHRVNDTQEGLITGEECSSACECVALEGIRKARCIMLVYLPASIPGSNAQTGSQ